MSRKAFSAIFVVLLWTIMVLRVNATEVEKVTLEPGDFKTLDFHLDKGQKCKGSLAVVSGNDIDFFIRSPNGDYPVELERINQDTSFEFVAEESGAYSGIFRNLFSSQSAILELSYDIYEPTMIDFFALALIVVGLSAVIVIVLWWKY